MSPRDRIHRQIEFYDLRVESPDFHKLLDDLKKAGFSYTEVAIVAGINPDTIRHLCRRNKTHNVKWRWELGEAILRLWNKFCRG